MTNTTREGKIQTILCAPFLNPPLDNIRGEQMKDTWDWQQREIDAVIEAELKAQTEEIIREVEGKMGPTHDDIRFATELRGLYQALEDEHDEEKLQRMFYQIVERISVAREEERERVLSWIKTRKGFAALRCDEYDQDVQYETAHTHSQIIEALDARRNFIKNKN